MIEKRDIPEKELRINTVRGVTVRDDFLQAIKDFYRDQPPKNLLWNFRDVDVSSFTPSDMQAIVEAMKRFTHSRVGGKSAIVAPRDLEFGFARMFEILGGQLDLEFEIAVFRETDEAMAWIEAEGAKGVKGDGQR